MRTYTKEAVEWRFRMLLAIVFVLTSLVIIKAMAIPGYSTIARLYGIVFGVGACAMGFWLVVRIMQKFKNLQWACVVSADGKVETYYTDNLYAHDKDLRDVRIRKIDPHPIAVTRSITFSKDGRVARCSIAVSVVPDINNLQAYADAHFGMLENVDTFVVRSILDGILKRMPDEGPFASSECQRKQLQTKLSEDGLVLDCMTSSMREDCYLLE